MVFNSLLNLDFNAVRMTRDPDGHGGWEVGFIEIPSILGRLRPATSREREVAAQEQRVITHVFYSETSANLGRGDYISPGLIVISGEDLRSSDIIVKIEGNREPSTADHHFEIDCIEYQPSVTQFLTEYRLLESGGVRLLEDGGFRLLE